MRIPTNAKIGFAILFMLNAWFSNPRHQNSDPKIIRKRNLETNITKHTLVDTRGPTKKSKWGP